MNLSKSNNKDYLINHFLVNNTEEKNSMDIKRNLRSSGRAKRCPVIFRFKGNLRCFFFFFGNLGRALSTRMGGWGEVYSST